MAAVLLLLASLSLQHVSSHDPATIDPEVSDEELKEHVRRLLTEAAIEVLSQHSQPVSREALPSLPFLAPESEESAHRLKRSLRQPTPPAPAQEARSSVPPPPALTVSEEELSHAYVSQTGVGNREELQLVSVSEGEVLPSASVLHHPEPILGLRCTRFDSRLLLASRSHSMVAVWRSSSMDPSSLLLDTRSLTCLVDLRGEQGSEVLAAQLDSVMSHQASGGEVRLSLLVRTTGYATGYGDTQAASRVQLRTLHVSPDARTCVPVSVLDLHGFPRQVAVLSSH